MIKIATTSVFVDDQRKAQAFYTDVLGFETRVDVPIGDAVWLTVGAAGAQPDVELLLEPGDSEIAKTYTSSLRKAGLPAIVFSVDDLAAEFERLSALGVRFVQEPVEYGPIIMAVIDDTVGNLLQLVQPLPPPVPRA
ncbi:VOC family protein [Georgenia sp. MJ206]|uniref:VOC family protein n=1 Tax=Georgenia wangjunii TaxID=3117730 RepID=UPI002F25FABD